MGTHSSKFLADVDFSKPTEVDIRQIMDYFQAHKAPGQQETTILSAMQARRFLRKLCKYQQIPPERCGLLVEYLMSRFDKDKDDQLSFEELSDQQLWKEVFQLVASAKTDTEAIWSEKLKAVKAAEQKGDGSLKSPALINSPSLDAAFAAAHAAAARSSQTQHNTALTVFPEDSLQAEEFWKSLQDDGKDANERAYDLFATSLAEAWDCSDDIAQKVAEMFVPPATHQGRYVAQRQDFIRFVRACGPWAEGAKNSMLTFILANFFQADQRTPRRVFHAYLNEAKAISLLKNRGDYLYRYSSRDFDGINITRFSTNVHANKEHAAETLHNTRQYSWSYDKQTYPTLQQFEIALKSKLITPILVGITTPTVGGSPQSVALPHMYSKSLANGSEDTSRLSKTNEEKTNEAARASLPSEKTPFYSDSLNTTPAPKPTINPGYAGDFGSAVTPVPAPRDPYYARGMGVETTK